MKITNEINLEFHQIENRDIFYRSFLPEFKDFNVKRSAWQISSIIPNSKSLTFRIQAEDATAFRATINSLILFANIVEKTIDLVDNYSKN